MESAAGNAVSPVETRRLQHRPWARRVHRAQLRPKILSVIGSRPEFIQAAPLAHALDSHVDEIIVNTGQHYDPELASEQILDVRLRRPDYDLAVGSRDDGEQLAVGEARIAEVIEVERPDAVLVRGDTNSTLSGARAAHRAGLPIVHVEAGLRSYRHDMPEERNRVETDRLSDLLCVPTRAGLEILKSEGIQGRIRLTGDVMFDMLLRCRDRVPVSSEPAPYALATIHRGYNTDDRDRLHAVLECLAAVEMPVVFPLHPRTRNRLAGWGLALPKNVEARSPVPYTTMLALERDAEVILTDSGGVQREAYMWGVSCITLREETEWVETVELGWNTLAGIDADRVREALGRELPADRPPVFGDGNAAENIASEVAVLLSVPAAVVS